MQPLSDGRRKTLFAIAAAICAVPAALAPLAGRSARELPPLAAVVGNSFELLPVRTARRPLDIRIGRDPFIPDRLAAPRGPMFRGAASLKVMQNCTTPIVRGVAIGERPQAIVACGERIELIGAGDRLNGSTVTSITPSGVVLTGGAVLPLSEDGE